MEAWLCGLCEANGLICVFSDKHSTTKRNAQAADERSAEARRDADELAARHSDLRRRARLLYAGYRALRYRLEDEWPPGAGAPPRAPSEDAVLAGSLEDVLK